MKIPIHSEFINIEELRAKLEKKFPGFETQKSSENALFIKKSKAIGAAVILKKKKIVIEGNFPHLWQQLLFLFLLLFTLFLIVLIVYLLTYHKKMKRLEREIGDFLKNEYQTAYAGSDDMVPKEENEI
ncbi:MAG: hypothetical protein KJ607_03280 [Bacteroidetes bacterium]|nr:hypothetical protein [Bacteroidota bacterium]